ncbi:hypothetical protein MUCCIDRAFT_156142, partial [Mucor lusitanicus CBS 277.49]
MALSDSVFAFLLPAVASSSMGGCCCVLMVAMLMAATQYKMVLGVLFLMSSSSMGTIL